MSPLLFLYAGIRKLLIFSISILLPISIFACSDKKDDIIGPNNSKTAPAKVGMMLSSTASINEITAIHLTVTGDDMQQVEADLLIDQENNKATGAIDIPIGDNRLFKVEVYAGNNLRYVGEQKADIHEAVSIQIHVNIKSAEGIGVISISEQLKGKGLVIAIGDSDVFLSKNGGNERLIRNIASMTIPSRLKLDVSHGLIIDPQKLRNIESFLTKNGLRVTRDESTKYDRSKYDIIFITPPTNEFSSDQIDSIYQFVTDGGMLILVADADDPLGYINSIASKFGLKFDNSTVSIRGGDPQSLFLRNFSTHSLFDDIKQIEISNARSVSIISETPDAEMRSYKASATGPTGIAVPEKYTGFPELSGGEWSEYDVTSKNTTMRLRYEYIGADVYNGRECSIMEYEMGSGPNTAIYQYWIDKEKKTTLLYLVKASGKVMKMEVVNTPNEVSVDTPSTYTPGKEIGSNIYTTPTGKNVNAVIFLFDSREMWGSSEVPFGIVKMVDNGKITMQLYDFGLSGAKRDISKEEAENAIPLNR